MRQTYGQRYSRAAGGKRRALVFDFPIRIWCMFWESKCRGESNLGLRTTSGLAIRVWTYLLRDVDVLSIWAFARALQQRILAYLDRDTGF